MRPALVLTWPWPPHFLLFLLLLLQGSSQYIVQDEAGGMLHRCEPQIRNVSRRFLEQKVVLTWEDGPLCLLTADQLSYDVDVLSTDQNTWTMHQDIAVVPGLPTGSAHSWSWDSPLPLQCANNRFKVRARYKDELGPWSRLQNISWITPLEKPEVFPKDRVVEVGSNVTFCCVLPTGESFHGMWVSSQGDNDTIALRIGSSQLYAVTVHLSGPSPFTGIDVTCNGPENGASVHVGYPPRVADLACETRDLESVVCRWSADGKVKGLALNVMHYTLLGSLCLEVEQCRHEEKIEARERNWTLTVKNVLGTLQLTDRADLTKRVHMFAPQKLSPSRVNARNASLAWEWSSPRYRELYIRCRVSLHHDGHTDVKNYSGLGLDRAHLRGLTPNVKYEAQVCCGTEEHFWKWGDNNTTNFQTEGDIPDALDVWVWTENNQSIIHWKTPPPDQSHGLILDYEVKWRASAAKPSEKQNRRTVLPPEHSAAVADLDPSRENDVTVTARNSHGRSLPASVVVVPGHAHPDEGAANVSRLAGGDGRLGVSWSAHPASSCGYMVVWMPTFARKPVDWKKLRGGEGTRFFITENLTPGVRYSVYVYACTEGPPRLLERREGYAQETRIPDEQISGLRWEHVAGSDVRVSWTAIPPQNRTTFVWGYVMYYHDLHAKDTGRNHAQYNVSTDNPEASSLTARDLHVGSYSFTVSALTSVGEGGANSITLTINPSDKSIVTIAVTFGLVFIVLITATGVAYKNWTRIKQRLCPPVPKPVLTCDWLTLTEDQLGNKFQTTTEGHRGQKEHVDVPQVFSDRGLLSTGADHEGAAFLQNHATNGYCGYYHQQHHQQQQQQQRHMMETNTLTMKSDVSQPVLPPAPCIFQNPCYSP